LFIRDPSVGFHCLPRVVHVEEKGGIDVLSARRDGGSLEVGVWADSVVHHPA